jgi:acyl-CoA reductase-like NAD-dependent aldehyde dehydrogenase
MSAPATATATLPVLDPATGEQIGEIPAGGQAEARAAVAAARAAQPRWARTPSAERAARLKDAARLLREHVEELAELQTHEGGKPIADSRGGVEAGIGAVEQYAELGPLHRGRSLQGAFGATDTMIREPRGVAGLLVPWNDPIAIACGQVAAALVTGNAVVLKPSEKTPLSTIRLVELLWPSLPGDVLRLLLGDGRAGAALAADAGVDVLVHTGAVDTGRQIAAARAPLLAKTVLELGGNDPLIVDAGVDPRWAAAEAASGAFANAGQVCTSVERIYVHRDLAAPFLEALVAEARALRPGPGLDSHTTLGPLIDERQRRQVHQHVTDALERGARALCGGAMPDGAGFFYPPTVLEGCHEEMLVMREETFGPVAPVQVVDSFDEALERANGSDYGLGASVLTPSQDHAQRASRELRAGTVKVNAVWGGAPGGAAEPRGQSGLGLGYGPELLDELTALKTVHLQPFSERRSGS